LVKGIPEAIKRSKANVVYNCNLMTKQGHTDGFSVCDFVREIERHIGKDRINHVTFNNTVPDKALLERYAGEGEYPVRTDDVDGGNCQAAFTPLPADLISPRVYVQKSGDAIRRTLIRHDPDVLAALIVQHCLGGV
jgi:2-phospho-L-lactate transferase/gluconeogenesis factor (CofD/UPF0052 family)